MAEVNTSTTAPTIACLIVLIEFRWFVFQSEHFARTRTSFSILGTRMRAQRTPVQGHSQAARSASTPGRAMCSRVEGNCCRGFLNIGCVLERDSSPRNAKTLCQKKHFSFLALEKNYRLLRRCPKRRKPFLKKFRNIKSPN
jgi:hypothetical protein